MRSGVPGFLGIRLKQAREALGLTQISLADLIGVSKQSVSQYEKGADSPSTVVFDRICSVLGHQPHFFLLANREFLFQGLCFYRSLAAATKTARVKAQTRQFWIRELLFVVSEDIKLPRPNLPNFNVPPDPTMFGMEQVELWASDLREFWGLGDGPVSNLTNVAELNGILIVRNSMDAETLDGMSEWLEPEGLPLVVLNSDKGIAVRSRLDLAHEIGHLVLHRALTAEQFKNPAIFELVEAQAFRFGAALLLPEHSFLEDLYSSSLDALRALKSKWKVSIAMMIERLKYLGIITDDQHRKLRVGYSTRKWNRAEPFDAEIPVEQPVFLARAIQMLIKERLLTIDQLVFRSGLSSEWIDRLLDLPTGLLTPRQPDVRILEFKRRA